jgi:hypothetical protein
MNRTYKFIILAFTFELFFVLPVSNLISVFGQALGGTSANSVSDNNNYNDNNTIAQRIGNTTNTTAGGLSASSVGDGAVASDRTGNITNTTAGGLSASSIGDRKQQITLSSLQGADKFFQYFYYHRYS